MTADILTLHVGAWSWKSLHGSWFVLFVQHTLIIRHLEFVNPGC